MSGNFGYMGRSNPWGDLDWMWLVVRYGGRNHVCNISWLSVKGCGCGERGTFCHWLDASLLQHWSHYRVTVWYTSTNGVVIPLAAQCGCQICLPSVFGNNGEPILPYCQHFHALHRNTATRSVSQHKASNFHFQFQSGRRLPWLRWHHNLSICFGSFAALSYVCLADKRCTMRQN